MGYEDDVITAIAERLEAAGVGVWDPAGAYHPGPEPAIFVGVHPDVRRPVITLTPYPVEAQLNPNDSILGIQVRTRAEGRDPRGTINLDGKVYDVLHGLTNLQLGDWRATKILFQSGTTMGQDGLERWGRTANYYLTGPRWPA